MVDNLNLTTLISQIPTAQQIHHAQVAHPEAQQALAQEMVLKRQKEEQKQVAKSAEASAEKEIDPETHHDSPQEFFMGERQRPAREPEPESDQGRLIDTQV